MDDSQIKAMVSYVIKYFNKKYPENLDAMIHLIGHDETYRRKVEEITEAILNNHDELFVAYSNGKKIEELTPKYAIQCEELRKKMKELVEKYISEDSNSSNV